MTPTPSGGGGPTLTPVTPPLRDNIFSGVKIASAYTYISEHKALPWPSAEDRANFMERTFVSALRVEMVLPVLQFGGLEAFAIDPRRAGRVLPGDSRTSGQLYAPIARVQKPGVHARPPSMPHLRSTTPSLSWPMPQFAATYGNSMSSQPYAQ